MPATLPNLYISARRLRRKQHIWMTDTGGGDTLLKIVPYRGTKMVAFSFWCKGVTEVRKQGRVVVPPQPHKQIIAFTDCNILPEGEKPDEKDRSNYFVVSYNGDDYWIEKINLNKQKAVVRCDCKDFIFSWAYSDFKNGCLWGPPPKKYIRKTPPPPQGRPYKNMMLYPGYCKHVFYVYKNFMLNRQQYSWAGTSQAVSGATYFHQ